jgi:TIR domain
VVSSSPVPVCPIEVFFSYAHRDETLRDELAKHLSLLQHQKVIAGWYDRHIPAGTEWAGAIDTHLENAQIILLLISADFMASTYCYGIEMQRAMERHEARQARVIPIILRAVDWKSAPFGRLQALPKDGLAVTSWANPDEAFADIARGIRSVAEERAPNPSWPHRVAPVRWGVAAISRGLRSGMCLTGAIPPLRGAAIFLRRSTAVVGRRGPSC